LYRADPRTSDGAEGVKGSINASREAIIAAGAFNTPQILKLSGIGPKDELDKWKIPVVKDLPGVGRKMQDRYETGLVGKAPSNFALTSKCTVPLWRLCLTPA
jgi:choline dehydrogenase